jgi:acetolactate synthase I/II/III large subunit
MTTTGTYLTQLLETYGVDTVFGIPGVHTIELYRGLARSPIRHITPRHEQGAGFMADGYARVTGKPGVCFIITGPGMTNISTAMGQAYGDSIPMLIISTVNAHGRMGTGEGWLHELPDQRGIFEKLTAFSATINSPEELAPALSRAFAVFDSARPRPVHIELPINVMLASADHLQVGPKLSRTMRPEPNRQQLLEAAAIISNARNPLILVGGGAVKASFPLRILAEKLGAPVVMTGNARGLLPPDHYLNVSLSATFPATRALVANADVVLAVGTELGPTDYDMFEDGGFSIPGKTIRIDIDPLQLMRRLTPDLAIVGDAAAALHTLSDLVTVSGRTGNDVSAASIKQGIALLPELARGDIVILEAIRNELPEAVFVGDSTQLVYSGNAAFSSAGPSTWFNCATGYGTLGYGLPAALGAKCGAPDRPIIALVGDGGILFTLSEMVVAVESGLPIIMLLHENGGYGEIKSYMVTGDIEPIGVDLWGPDFAKIADGFGWLTAKVECLKDLITEVQKAAKATLPTVVIFRDETRREAARETLSNINRLVGSDIV